MVLEDGRKGGFMGFEEDEAHKLTPEELLSRIRALSAARGALLERCEDVILVEGDAVRNVRSKSFEMASLLGNPRLAGGLSSLNVLDILACSGNLEIQAMLVYRAMTIDRLTEEGGTRYE